MERLTIQAAIDHCNEVVGTACQSCADEHKQLAEWLTDLARYKQLEADGRLVTLPNHKICADDFRIGMYVYNIIGVYDAKKRKYTKRIIACEVTGVYKDETGEYVLWKSVTCGIGEFRVDDFGKTVFLDRESALAKLEGEK